MRTAFQPHVRAALVNGDLILLDLAADDYVCVVGAGEGPKRALSDPVSLPVDVISLLGEADLLQSGESADNRPEPTVVARRDLRDDPPGRFDMGVCVDLILTALELQRLGPEATLSDLSGVSRTSKPVLRDDELETRRIARAVARLLPWLPMDGQCLQRSALLMGVLRRRGLRADWVFGVRTWPFRAHCWVQISDLCLNDHFERLRAYTPIDVVRG